MVKVINVKSSGPSTSRSTPYDEWLEKKERERYLKRAEKQGHQVKAPKVQAPRILRPTNLYWAYGSNLSIDRMKQRCPDARVHGPLTVPDARIVFRGVADVTRDEEYVTPGGLWHITEDCEYRLDRYEGVASRLYLKRFLTVKVSGRVRQVLFYQMQTSRGIMPPSEKYFDVIKQGYGDFGLNEDVLWRSLEHSWSNKELTPLMRQRYDNHGRPKAKRVPDSAAEDSGVVTSVNMKRKDA